MGGGVEAGGVVRRRDGGQQRDVGEPGAFAASMTLSMPLTAAGTDSGAAGSRPTSSTESATVVSGGELAARTVLPAVRNGPTTIPRTPVMRLGQ